MYCKECGKKIDNDSKYCKFCGKAQHEKQNLDVENPFAESIEDRELNKLEFPVYDYPKVLFDFESEKEI
ncbi:MAG: hypothetical protein ACOCWD_06600 [Tangfeifania sp.]